jgi:hypothetical protein
MKIKVKKVNKDGLVRLETSGEIKDVLINEDFLSPNDETIALCFRGENSSGIVELRTKEFEEVYKQIRKRIHLIKGIKILD